MSGLINLRKNNTMHTLYKLKEGFIVTSAGEILGGNIVLVNDKDHNNSLRIFTTVFCGDKKGCKKVIAQQDQIYFSDSPEDQQKNIGWFDVEESWEQDTKTTSFGETNKVEHFKNYKKGFQKAQELLSDRMFTLEDVVKIVHMWDNYINVHEEDKGSINVIKKFIQSLSQPKSWDIEGEWKENKFFVTKIK